jgi:hypothetical protein
MEEHTEQLMTDKTKILSPETPMDIKQAKALFVQYRGHLSPDYLRLAQLIRRHGISLPVPNENYLHGLCLTDMLLGFVNESLRILTGSITEGVPECLRDKFEAAVARIQKAGGTARIVVLGNDSGQLKSLQDKYGRTLLIREARPASGAIIRHFIVGDTELVRDEEPHADLREESDANEIKASVYFNNKEKAAVLSTAFDAIWDKLKADSK